MSNSRSRRPKQNFLASMKNMNFSVFWPSSRLNYLGSAGEKTIASSFFLFTHRDLRVCSWQASTTTVSLSISSS